MQIKFNLNTEKYRHVKFTDGLFYLKEIFEDKFPMLDTLDVNISEVSIYAMNKYQKPTPVHAPRNRSYRLHVFIYPGSDAISFKGAVEHELERLRSALEEQVTV